MVELNRKYPSLGKFKCLISSKCQKKRKIYFRIKKYGGDPNNLFSHPANPTNPDIAVNLKEKLEGKSKYICSLS